MPERVAIIGGTGVERPVDGFREQVVATPHGEALVYLGEGKFADHVFLSRHGTSHDIPPHCVNYRANICALQQLGVERIMASFAVGSIAEDIPPGSLVAIDQILDFTYGREHTFFDGSERGVRHVAFTEPTCSGLRQTAVDLAPRFGVTIRPRGTYICFNGPRFETAAEIRMFGAWGAEVVGMTAMPEAALARELEMHYAGIAVSINWAAGVHGALVIEEHVLGGMRGRLLPLLLETLRTADVASCSCQETGHVIEGP